VLVGFMGAGKSTLAPEVARLLGWASLDMDAEIERRRGTTVAELFERDGEAAFREEERRLAAELAARTELVVAAGGGAFAQEATRAALRAGAATVWLRCDLDTALARLAPDGRRPLARSRETIGPLFAAREPSYRLADHVVDAAADPPAVVARRIVDVVFAGRPSRPRRTSGG
jgi:shikimate kinase